MAYNKYDSDKQAVSYMDGIPVKISEKYKPPKKIILPGTILNKLNLETELPEYDFTLERSVMDKMSQWRHLRQSQREAQRERLDAEKQGKAATETTASSEEKSPLPERAVSSPSSEPYPILMPIPINASTHSQCTNYSKSFNISDFEQDTSPFDNMELKTINDLEELAHVLQPNGVSDKNEVNSDKKKTPPPRLNGFNTQYGYNGSINWTNNYNQISDEEYHSWYQDPIPMSRPPTCNPTIQSYVVQRLDMGGQNSKSVPDIVQQLELELRDKRKAEAHKHLGQPERPASIGPAEVHPHLMTRSDRRSRNDWKVPTTSLTMANARNNPLSGKSLSSLESTRHSVSPKSTSSLPNPYAQLTASCQQLADRLTEMGFPLPRVARAAELFGDDETRIVEFLVQVQRLQEMNYPPDRAERALIANNYKQSETIEYLNIIGQLLDLGFREDKVEHALVECGSDRDKALDLLVS